ncbi:MAG TPA: SDR family oxidoreductase [Mycobacterium sp.]|nr:SDR family oxidoreductase [Mycobacterium sp.]
MNARQVALVTGASRGIGREIALEFARAGFDVAITARTVREGEGRVPARDRTAGQRELPVPGSLDTTVAELREQGVRALAVRMDLLDLAAVEAAAEPVLNAWGRIDVLVNNAIAQIDGTMDRLLDIRLDEAGAMIVGNYLHQLALIQHVVPAMLDAGGGVIINMTSGSVDNEPPGPVGEGGWGLSYAASKAAFSRIAGIINAELGPRGVRAFNLNPGYVITESGRARGGSESTAAAGFPAVPAGAAARAAVWLATSPDANRLLGKSVWAPKVAADLADQHEG